MNEDISRIINPICDAFDAAKSNGGNPEIPKFLEQAPVEYRRQLLPELLKIELEYRESHGISCAPVEFAELGEDAVGLVEELQAKSFDRDAATRLDQPVTQASSHFVGPYKLLQKIGEGGMGTVWMAEQTQPVRRRVAIKLIKRGMDSKQVLARFEAERQALSMMNHANIARVLDCGTTDEGIPFFAMELVKGVSITKYCDSNQLDIGSRLKLFKDVCGAIQHAHQKGIIHRDLKPSNVLVSLYDGVPVAKVIDFGLAKALDNQNRLTDRTMFTEFGQIVGTFQYMSPEQAEMNELDVDTRTDIYSLGVILYELLTGTTPLEKSSIERKAHLRVLEMIRDWEPPKPSSRISQSGAEAVVGISKQRQSEPLRLQNMLKGDLDWIVMKALDKNRSRRYETAKDFAADISNFVGGDIVAARPPTAAYRLQKSFHKNRGAFLAALALLFLLCSGIVATSWQAYRATTAETNAKENEEKAVQARRIAEEEKQNAIVANQRVAVVNEQLELEKDELRKNNVALEFQRFADSHQFILREIQNGNYQEARLNASTLAKSSNYQSASVDTRILRTISIDPWKLRAHSIFCDWHILDFDWNPDTEQVVATDASGQFHMFDFANPDEIKSWGTHFFRDDILRSAHLIEKTLLPQREISIREDSRVPIKEPTRFVGVKWISDAKFEVVSESGDQLIVSTKDGTCESKKITSEKISRAIWFGKRKIVGTEQGSLILVEADGSEELNIKLNSPVNAICVDSSGTNCYVCLANKKVVAVDLESKESATLTELMHEPFCIECVQNNDSVRLLVGGNSRLIASINRNADECRTDYFPITGIDQTDHIEIDNVAKKVFLVDGIGKAVVTDLAFQSYQRFEFERKNMRHSAILDLCEKDLPDLIPPSNRFKSKLIVVGEGEKRTVLAGGQGALISKWQLEKEPLGKPSISRTPVDRPVGIEFVSGFPNLCWCLDQTGTLSVLDIYENSVVDSIQAHKSGTELRVFPRQEILGTVGRDAYIKFWQFSDGKIVADKDCGHVKFPSDIMSFDLHPSKKVVIATDTSAVIHRFDLVSKRAASCRISASENDAEPFSGRIRFNCDGSHFAAYGAGQNFAIFDSRTLAKCGANITTQHLGGIHLHWAANNKRLLVGSDGFELYKWQFSKDYDSCFGSNPLWQRTSEKTASAASLKLTNDNKRILALFPTGQIAFLDAERLENIWSIESGLASVVDVAISPECDRVLVISKDGYLAKIESKAFQESRGTKLEKNIWACKTLFDDDQSRFNVNRNAVVNSDNGLHFLLTARSRLIEFKNAFSNKDVVNASNSAAYTVNDVSLVSIDTAGATTINPIKELVADWPSQHHENCSALKQLSASRFGIVLRRQRTAETRWSGEVVVCVGSPQKGWQVEKAIEHDDSNSSITNSGFYPFINGVDAQGRIDEIIHQSFYGYNTLHTVKRNGKWQTSAFGSQGDGQYGLACVLLENTTLVAGVGIRFQNDFFRQKSYEFSEGKVENATTNFSNYRRELGSRRGKYVFGLRQDEDGSCYRLLPNNTGAAPRFQLLKYSDAKEWLPLFSAPTIPSYADFMDFGIRNGRLKILATLDNGDSGLQLGFLNSTETGHECEIIHECKRGEKIDKAFLFFDTNGRELVLLFGYSGKEGGWIRLLTRN